MPNAKCDFCGKWMEDILLSCHHKIVLVKLIKERRQHVFGPIFKIVPGIKHNEVNIETICTGSLYYYPIAPTPKKFSNMDLNDLFIGGGDIDDLINRLEEENEHVPKVVTMEHRT